MNKKRKPARARCKDQRYARAHSLHTTRDEEKRAQDENNNRNSSCKVAAKILTITTINRKPQKKKKKNRKLNAQPHKWLLNQCGFFFISSLLCLIFLCMVDAMLAQFLWSQF